MDKRSRITYRKNSYIIYKKNISRAPGSRAHSNLIRVLNLGRKNAAEIHNTSWTNKNGSDTGKRKSEYRKRKKKTAENDTNPGGSSESEFEKRNLDIVRSPEQQFSGRGSAPDSHIRERADEGRSEKKAARIY